MCLKDIALPTFPSHPKCRLCNLGGTTTTTGMKMTTWKPPVNLKTPNTQMGVSDSALLVLGHQPGLEEDKRGEPFVGPSGQILKQAFLPGVDLDTLTTVYFSNLVRCWPRDSKPTATHVRACIPYLLDDMEKIAATHPKGPRIVLLLGSETTKLFTQQAFGKKLDQSFLFRNPGYVADIVGREWLIFSTIHPAALLPGRAPSSIVSVAAHMQLVADTIIGTRVSPVPVDLRPPGPPPKEIP